VRRALWSITTIIARESQRVSLVRELYFVRVAVNVLVRNCTVAAHPYGALISK
jgi:hypothetical protein